MKHWIFGAGYGTIPSFQPSFAIQLSVIPLPSYRPILQILLAILMMAGGAVETLAASYAASVSGNTGPSERTPLSEEDDNEIEKEGRLEERQTVEHAHSDRRLNTDHHFTARDSNAIQHHPIRSQRPIDLGRSPPVLC